MAREDIITNMAISFFQKIRLMLRGSRRRREERDQEFLKRNVSWIADKAPAAAPAPRKQSAGPALDTEGLQVAFLDDSGRIAHYLDLDTGEIVELHAGEALPDVAQNSPRYKRVPRRTAESDAADRRKFVASLDPSAMRDRLATAADAAAFRRILSNDRTLERAWFVFKNDAATAAIETWLQDIGKAWLP
ncbi:MAG: hypothetical protein ACXW3E_15595 [Thermoanaerobaculia bacterium]